jgi:hypothetical protein
MNSTASIAQQVYGLLAVMPGVDAVTDAGLRDELVACEQAAHMLLARQAELTALLPSVHARQLYDTVNGVAHAAADGDLPTVECAGQHSRRPPTAPRSTLGKQLGVHPTRTGSPVA